jgi:signal transduction histidine kinase
VESRQKLERGLREADKLITLGQLSAVLAHEIGSPLQVVEGRARSMLKRSDVETVQRVVPLIVEQTERITRIVQQMLSMTRRRAPSRQWVDAAKAADSVVALLKLEARTQSVKLSLLTSGDTTLWADSDQLQQVVLNLVRNAIQAAPPETAVAVSLARVGDEVVLEVCDQGGGVSVELQEKLFEPFFTTRSTVGGTGLGLSVVRTIVQEHHGDVAFIAQTVGTRVRVTFPNKHEGA